MHEAYMDNRHPRIIEWNEVDRGLPSPQGLEIFFKYEGMEFHLETQVIPDKINQKNEGRTLADAYTANIRFDSSKAKRHV